MVPFRLQLAEGNGPPAWDGAQRVLTVQLPKAGVATVRLSSYVNKDDLALLGVWLWSVDFLKSQATQPGDDAQLQIILGILTFTATSGLLWGITPNRELTLVHAVQQPLLAPTVLSFTAVKFTGLTFAFIGAKVRIHGRSTAKLDLLGSWQESVDRLQDPGPRTFPASTQVFDVPIVLDAPPPPPQPPETLVAPTMPIATYDQPSDLVTFNAPSAADSSNGPPAQVFLSRHEFGDTRYRRVTYQAVATTRFREYFSAALANAPGSLTRSSPLIAVDVLNSARPTAPRCCTSSRCSTGAPPPIPPAPRQSGRGPAADCAFTSHGLGSRPARASCSASCSRPTPTSRRPTRSCPS